jgi:hypothetical protein
MLPIPTMMERWTKRNYGRAPGRHCCGCCNDLRLGMVRITGEPAPYTGYLPRGVPKGKRGLSPYIEYDVADCFSALAELMR